MNAPDRHERGDAAPDASVGGGLAQADARLQHLFRLWLRDGHVHPLMHLVRRYRQNPEDPS